MEEVCFLQHIFACIVDKVSRNWLMDIFKYTQCILPFLFRDSLTCMESQVAFNKFKGSLFMSKISTLLARFARSLLKVRVSLSPIELEKNEWNKIVLFDPLCYTVKKKEISRHQTSPYNTRVKQNNFVTHEERALELIKSDLGFHARKWVAE